MEQHLSHFNERGQAEMVDVGGKPATLRTAVAQAFVTVDSAVLARLTDNPKGNPVEVARIAGILAAKKTAELIPMCHPLPLSYADVRITLEASGFEVEAEARTAAQTGVEMEAMTAASVAALTLYDMLKSLDKSIEIRSVHLRAKTGGKSGDYRRPPAELQK